MSSNEGFPDNSKFTPVPNLLFGSLLEEIDDLAVLKCILRVLWLNSQKKGFPRFLTQDELISDRTFSRILSTSRTPFDKVLEKIERLGSLIHMRMMGEQGVVDVYMPNSQEGRKTALYLRANSLDIPLPTTAKPQADQTARSNIFSLYEENIGIIGHIMAEELKEAEKDYPQEWVEEAFKEAVVHNKRSWRYIEAILKGWTTEGREHGEPGRHSKKVDAREWIRRHGLPRQSR
jgi:DNA replication protein